MTTPTPPPARTRAGGVWHRYGDTAVTQAATTLNDVQFINADAAHLPLADDSVDLVFCSPPYEDARWYGDLRFKLTGQGWVDWCVPRFLECLRVSRGLVAWVVEGKTKRFRYSAAPVLLMADLHRAGVHLRKPPAYHRVGIPGSGGPDWLRNDYEFIVCAAPGGKLPWSDNTACGHAPKFGTGGACTNRNADGRRLNQAKYGDPNGNGESKRRRSLAGRDGFGFTNGGGRGRFQDGLKKPTKKVCGNSRRQNGEVERGGYALPKIANPGNVITCKVGGGHMGHALAHENEAPFPLALAEFFVRSFCPPGGVALDPFAGSGTTAHAAVLHGRRAILADIRDEQLDLSRRRIADVLSDLRDQAEPDQEAVA